jgi:HD-GYP domain-containing protein (c-di-GMP phosphodiesterase class II)
VDRIKRFISVLSSAVSNCSLYSKEHPHVEELIRRGFDLLNEILTQKHKIEIMIIEDKLIVNKIPFRDSGVYSFNFTKILKRKGISRIDFLEGLNISEMKQFVQDLSERGRELRRYPHIRSGVVDINIRSYPADREINVDNLPAFRNQQIERIKEIYHDISPFKKLNSAGIEDLIINFVITLKKEVNILKLIIPVKEYSEYTYTHATNVAILSMFQAESLGVKDELLHDIGIAALLHDVGKLFVPKEILEKEKTLEEKEWEEIKRHPLYGAIYLAKLKDIAYLASIVTFEHHLRYDNKGYPELKTNRKKQHLCSQIVAISDFFDALRSIRPYKKAWSLEEIIPLLKKNSGSEFNPFLVDNFIRNISLALEEK